MRWYLVHGNCSVFVEDGTTWFLTVHGDCEHLLPDHRCGIYETRPQVCRDYSNATCEYDGDGRHDRLFECAEQLLEYAEAVLPPVGAVRPEDLTSVPPPRTRRRCCRSSTSFSPSRPRSLGVRPVPRPHQTADAPRVPRRAARRGRGCGNPSSTPRRACSAATGSARSTRRRWSTRRSCSARATPRPAGQETAKQTFRFDGQRRPRRGPAVRPDGAVRAIRRPARRSSSARRSSATTSPPSGGGERPQKGRYREFVQCDFDTIGTTGVAADAETVCVIHDLLATISRVGAAVLRRVRRSG